MATTPRPPPSLTGPPTRRGWFLMPRGTTLVFYCEDNQTLRDRAGMAVETGAAEIREDWVADPGSRVPNYAIAHPHGLTVTRL